MLPRGASLQVVVTTRAVGNKSYDEVSIFRDGAPRRALVERSVIELNLTRILQISCFKSLMRQSESTEIVSCAPARRRPTTLPSCVPGPTTALLALRHLGENPDVALWDATTSGDWCDLNLATPEGPSRSRQMSVSSDTVRRGADRFSSYESKSTRGKDTGSQSS